MPTVPTCAVREVASRHNGGTAGAPLKPLRVDSAWRKLEENFRIAGFRRRAVNCFQVSIFLSYQNLTTNIAGLNICSMTHEPVMFWILGDCYSWKINIFPPITDICIYYRHLMYRLYNNNIYRLNDIFPTQKPNFYVVRRIIRLVLYNYWNYFFHKKKTIKILQAESSRKI